MVWLPSSRNDVHQRLWNPDLRGGELFPFLTFMQPAATARCSERDCHGVLFASPECGHAIVIALPEVSTARAAAKRGEHCLVEALIAKSTNKALDEGILLRPEHHVPNSIPTQRRQLIIKLVANFSRCPCVQPRHRCAHAVICDAVILGAMHGRPFRRPIGRNLELSNVPCDVSLAE